MALPALVVRAGMQQLEDAEMWLFPAWEELHNPVQAGNTEQWAAGLTPGVGKGGLADPGPFQTNKEAARQTSQSFP